MIAPGIRVFRIYFLFSLIVGLFFSRPVAAEPLYGVTDLGSSYQFQTDASGQINDVTAADGRTTYAFDKAPVTAISERAIFPPNLSHFYSYTMYTLSEGPYKVGYYYDYNYSGTSTIPNLPHEFFFPTFNHAEHGWFTTPGTSPVTDLNAHGQVVGLGQYYDKPGTYAAFSDVNGQSHGSGPDLPDNLNLYIPPLAGVSLTEALKIDDDGRILTAGSNGDYYLLTPVGLGDPVPVPEPTVLMAFLTVAVGLGIQRYRRVL